MRTHGDNLEDTLENGLWADDPSPLAAEHKSQEAINQPKRSKTPANHPIVIDSSPSPQEPHRNEGQRGAVVIENLPEPARTLDDKPTGPTQTEKKGRSRLFTENLPEAAKRPGLGQLVDALPLSESSRKRKYGGTSRVADEVDTITTITKRAARGTPVEASDLIRLKTALKAIFPFNQLSEPNAQGAEPNAETNAGNNALSETVRALTTMTEGRIANLEAQRHSDRREWEEFRSTSSNNQRDNDYRRAAWEERVRILEDKPAGSNNPTKEWEDKMLHTVKQQLDKRYDEITKIVAKSALTPFPWNYYPSEKLGDNNFMQKVKLYLPHPILEFLEGWEALTYNEPKENPTRQLAERFLTKPGRDGATLRNKLLRYCLRTAPTLGELLKMRMFPSLLSRTALITSLAPLAMWTTLIWNLAGKEATTDSRIVGKINAKLADLKNRTGITLGEITEFLDEILPKYVESWNWGHPADKDFDDILWYSNAILPTEIQLENGQAFDDISHFGTLPTTGDRTGAPMPSSGTNAAHSSPSPSLQQEEIYDELRTVVNHVGDTIPNIFNKLFNRKRKDTLYSQEANSSVPSTSNDIEFDYGQDFDYENM